MTKGRIWEGGKKERKQKCMKERGRGGKGRAGQIEERGDSKGRREGREERGS